MKLRNIYLRKKNKKTILEGQKSKKPVYFMTIPEANKFFLKILLESSFLTEEKKQELRQKFNSLDYKQNKGAAGA